MRSLTWRNNVVFFFCKLITLYFVVVVFLSFRFPWIHWAVVDETKGSVDIYLVNVVYQINDYI